MKRNAIEAALACVALVLAGCTAEADTDRPAAAIAADTSARAPTLDDLRGLTVHGVFDEPVRMQGGMYEGTAADSVAPPRLELLERSVRLGDLDGDSIDDAAALVVGTDAARAVGTHLVVVRARGDSAMNVGTTGIGDRVVVRRMEIQDGAIVIDVVEPGDGEPPCCPTRKGVRRYWIEGDSLAGSTAIADSVSAAELEGTEWHLVAIDAGAVPEDLVITAAFAGGSVRGSAGCNDYTAAIDSTAGLDLRFRPPTSTLRACAAPAGDWERRFLDGLRTTARFTRILDDLVFTFVRQDGSIGILRFRPA